MKLSSVINTLVEASNTSEEAKKLGLVYAGYGRWKDPQTNKIVAKTINGQLVKTEDDSAEPGTMQAQQGAEPTQGGVADIDAPDDVEPDVEQEPVMQTGVARLLAAANGDVLKVKKALAKRYRAGDETQKAKVQQYMAQLDAHEAREKEAIKAKQAEFDAKRAEDLAKKKAKYAEKYPSPKI